MKPLLIVLFVLGTSKAFFAQGDITFPNVYAISTVIWGCQHPNDPPTSVWEVFQYFPVPADTIDGLFWGTLNNSGSQVGKIAVEGSKVWFRSTLDYGCYLCVVPPADTSVLLYDFALQVGDTAYRKEFWFMGDLAPPMIVTAVDTVVIEGRPRRLLEISDEWGNVEDLWLEGIGGLNGILSPLYGIGLGCVFMSYTWCADYLDQDDVNYTFCWDIVLSTEEPGPGRTLVYPNPCADQLFISTDKSHRELRLFDLNGRQVLSMNTNSASTTLDVGGLNSGIYILWIDDHVHKVIVE